MNERRTCDIYEAMWLARLHAATAHALYVHVPFCVRKCAYCDFASRETRRDDPLMVAYVHALGAQMRETSALGLTAGCETAFLGGGTPTFLGADLLAQLVREVRDACPDLVELTCEANPDSLTDEVLAALVEAGATRLSIGVQSLDDEELAALGRVHDAACARERVAAAVATGLDVSCDLMCATPRQTDESWARTLDKVVALGVDHVSVYPLQIEEGTPLARSVGDDDPAWNDPDVQAARMEAAERVLTAAGFARYEVASYAHEGHACRHNQMYWTGRPYVGLGAGASSMLTREGYERLCVAYPHLPAPSDDVARVRLTITSGQRKIADDPSLANLSFDLEFLDEGQAAAEDLMLGMRRTAGAHPGLIAHARTVLGVARVNKTLEDCVARGLACWDSGWLKPTHEGWLLGNGLFGALWDLVESEVPTLTVER